MLTLLAALVREMADRAGGSGTARHWRIAGRSKVAITIIITVLQKVSQLNRSLFRLIVQKRSSAERIVFFSNILLFILVKFLIQ